MTIIHLNILLSLLLSETKRITLPTKSWEQFSHSFLFELPLIQAVNYDINNLKTNSLVRGVANTIIITSNQDSKDIYVVR